MPVESTATPVESFFGGLHSFYDCAAVDFVMFDFPQTFLRYA